MKETQHTALLIMDVQPGIIDRTQDKEDFIQRTNTAIDAARASNMLVIFVVVGFRAGFPEIYERNKVSGPLKERAPDFMIDPKPLVSMKEGDILVTKRRVSAFSGSDLEVILRAKEIKHLVLGGIITSGVVLSTLREASDKDYTITVLSDLCADPNPDVQTVLMEKVFPWQAEVMTSEEWIKN